MQSITALINQTEEMLIQAKQGDIYTVQFSRGIPVSVEQAMNIIQDIKNIPNIETHPIWAGIKDFSSYNITNTYGLRRLCTNLILKNAGLFTFCYSEPIITEAILKPVEVKDYKPTTMYLAIADYNSSIAKINQLITAINEIYKKYFDDSIILVQNNLALKELEARIDFTKNDFNSQLPWLKDFQDNMLDDVSKKSFAHYLRERFNAQIFLGIYTLYPVSPPTERAIYREECFKKHLDFPSSYAPYEAFCEYTLFNENIKAKTNLPTLLNTSGKESRGTLFHTFIYEQYGISGKCEVQEGDIVIDAGAFIGDTAIYFSQKVGANNKGKVYAFEPIAITAESIRQNCKINKCANIEVVQAALSDKNEIQNFEIVSNSSFGSAKKSNIKTEYSAKAIRLDDFIKSNNIPTINFIKMDVEGAEMEILEGAKESISHFKPDCAICVYHKKNDYWDIAHFLLEQCPDYKFYFRCDAEPVLFATVRNAK